MSDYLITVAPKREYEPVMVVHRLIDKSEDYKNGFLAAVEDEYGNNEKFIITCEIIKEIENGKN